jgi:hypothetical protein
MRLEPLRWSRAGVIVGSFGTPSPGFAGPGQRAQSAAGPSHVPSWVGWRQGSNRPAGLHGRAVEGAVSSDGELSAGAGAGVADPTDRLRANTTWRLRRCRRIPRAAGTSSPAGSARRSRAVGSSRAPPYSRMPGPCLARPSTCTILESRSIVSGAGAFPLHGQTPQQGRITPSDQRLRVHGGWRARRRRTRQAAEAEGVEMEQVAGRKWLRLRPEKLRPARSRTPRCGVDPGCVQNGPDGSGADLVAEAREFAVDPPVPLPGFSVARRRTRACRPSGMPGRPGRAGWSSERAAHDALATVRTHARIASIPGGVRPSTRISTSLAVGPGIQCRPAQHSGCHHVCESEGHGDGLSWSGLPLWITASTGEGA